MICDRPRAALRLIILPDGRGGLPPGVKGLIVLVIEVTRNATAVPPRAPASSKVSTVRAAAAEIEPRLLGGALEGPACRAT